MLLPLSMEHALAYSTLAMTVSLAVLRPRIGLRSLRFTPGTAAVLGVLVLIAAGGLHPADLVAALHLQWRPLVALTSIMVMTGVVQEVGVFDWLAGWLEARARRVSTLRAFTLLFALAVAVPALLNNDAAILTLTPLVISLTRRLYPGRTDVAIAFAFAVFLAPGVAPFVVSNPMNMIVAGYAGIGFLDYAALMLPISLAGAALTYAILRWRYGALLRSVAPVAIAPPRAPRHAAFWPAIALMLAVFLAYPIAAALGVEIWFVAVLGALGALAIVRGYGVASTRTIAGHVSLDTLAFLWGIFAIVQALRSVGIVDALAALYQIAPDHQLAVIGSVSATGSALIDNHPMALLNMMAIDATGDPRPLLAALVGGDIGPRLLPIGSLAGLLWMDLLRRAGIEIGIGRFIRIGTLVLVPTLALSLAMLWLL